jgi:long-chain fatty acid transport protein
MRVLAMALLLGVSSLGLSTPSSAQCGGLCLYETGTPDQGSSAAGAGARAQDAGTALWNPAGMTRLDGTHIMIGSVLSYGALSFDSSSSSSTVGGDGGSAGGFVALAGSYVVTDLPSKLLEGLRFGFALSGLYGGAVSYDNDWAGRAFVTENQLGALVLQPTLAYQVTDWLSIGVGGSAVYTRFTQKWKANLDPASPTINIQGSDDWGGNAFVGIMLEPNERTRFGATYRSRTQQSLEGRVDIPFTFDADLTIDWDLPQGFNASVFHQLTERVGLMGDVGWSDWSEFGAQLYGVSVFGQSSDIPIDRGWKDTWRIGVGTRFQALEQLLVMGGFSYDSSPVRDSKRLPDIPIGEGYRFSVGTEFTPGEAVKIALAYTFLWMGKMEVDQVTLPGSTVTLDGEYNPSSIHFLGIMLEVNF